MKVIHESKFFRKLNPLFIVKFYGAAQIREEDRLRVTLVMEPCKENLMGRIFQNQDNIPSLSSTPGAVRSEFDGLETSPMLSSSYTVGALFKEILSWKTWKVRKMTHR